MTSPARDIADHLALEGFGTLGGSIFVSEEPTGPNECITIYDTGGAIPLSVDIRLYEPTIQVRVRSISYAAGYALQEEIRESIVQPLTLIINDSHYSGLFQQSDIISLGRDQNSRYILTANYRLQRQPL